MRVASAGAFDRGGERRRRRAARVERLAGEGVDRGDELVGRVVGLAGGGGQVPAVDEAVEHDEAGERLAGDLAEGRGDRPRRARRAR